MKNLVNYTLTVFISLSSLTILHADWLDKAKDFLDESEIPSATTTLTNSEVTAGLKDALKVGSEIVVKKLSTTDGFNSDPNVHIPLPDELETMQKALNTVGMSNLLDDLELRLNRAAEIATPKAEQLFYDAISEMNIDDARNILKGPDNAATLYFKNKMTPDLKNEFTPIVEDSLSDAGALQSYDRATSQYKDIPLMPDVTVELNEYVVDKGIEGIFYYLAQEESKIRHDPAARSTDILKKVFAD